MRPNPLFLLLPCALLSTAAGPCRDQSIGGVTDGAVGTDVRPTTPRADAGGVAVDGPTPDAQASGSDTGIMLVACAPVVAGITLSYIAKANDGRWIVLMHGGTDIEVGNYRLFLGAAPTEMKEHKITKVDVANDGGSHWVSFDLEGASAEVILPPPLTWMGPVSVNPRLTDGGRTTFVAVINPAVTAPPDFRYFCSPAYVAPWPPR